MLDSVWSFPFRIFMMSAIFGLLLMPLSASPVRADGCNQYIYHWGKTSHSKWRAKRNALKGVRWKLRTQISGDYGFSRRPRVVRCKKRSSWKWQCRALVVINRCF